MYKAISSALLARQAILKIKTKKESITKKLDWKQIWLVHLVALYFFMWPSMIV